jgi:5-hydroxyisourate hydrolase-like protein (transthyretin family)
VPAGLVEAAVHTTRSGAVAARVAALAEGVTPTLFLTKAKLAAACLLAVGVLAAGAGLMMSREAATPQAVAQPAEVPKRPAAEAQPPAARETKGEPVVVSGRVLDPDGRPVAGAKVAPCLPAFNPGTPSEGRAVGTTCAPDGSFRFEIPRTDFNTVEQDTPWSKATVVAAAPGYGPGWVSFDRAGAATGLTLKLVKDDVPINGRVLDLEGQPVAGVTVRVEAVDEIAVPVLPQPVTTTGADGRFRLTGLGRDRTVQLSLRGPTIEARDRDVYVMTRDAKPFHRPVNEKAPELGNVSYYGATFDHVAAPTKPIVGTVRDQDTGKPLAGVTVQSYFFAASGTLVRDFLRTTTDEAGRYRLVGMPPGGGHQIMAVPGPGQPYFSSRRRVGTSPGLDPVQVDFPLKQGLWVRGRVLDKATGKPVRARVRYGAFLDNPHLRGVPAYEGSVDAVTRADGSFELVGLPGRGLLAVKADEDRFLPSVGADQVPAADKHVTNFELIQTNPCFPSAEYHAFVPIHPAAGDKDTTCDVVLDPGRTVTGTLVGPDGQPVDGVMVMDLKLMWSNPQPLPGAQFTVTALDPRSPRWLFFRHRDKQLGAAVQVRGDEGQPLTVRLQPCASVTGRLLDAKGRGCPEAEIYGQSENSYMSLTTGRWWQLYVSGRTDREGRFRVDGLIPGVKYAIAVGDQGFAQTLGPGAVKDLGDTRMKTSEE